MVPLTFSYLFIIYRWQRQLPVLVTQASQVHFLPECPSLSPLPSIMFWGSHLKLSVTESLRGLQAAFPLPPTYLCLALSLGASSWSALRGLHQTQKLSVVHLRSLQCICVMVEVQPCLAVISRAFTVDLSSVSTSYPSLIHQSVHVFVILPSPVGLPGAQTVSLPVKVTSCPQPVGVGASWYSWMLAFLCCFVEKNLTCARFSLALLSGNGVYRFFYFNSCLVYGDNKQILIYHISDKC